MRCKAVDNLSESRNPSDTERIFASLQDQSPQVRCAAVRALSRTNTPDSQKSLVSALQDECFEVRESAARALGRLGARNAADDLAVGLNDPDTAVRIAAAGALRTLGWKPSTRRESAWFEITLGTIQAPAPAGNVPTAPVFTGSNQDTSFHRRLAAAQLEEQNDPRRIKALLTDLQSADLLARISAIHDLAQIGDSHIIKELLKLFRDPEPEARLAAIQVLAARDDSPPAYFLGLLQDANSEIRLAAVQLLGRRHSQQIAEVLLPLMSDPSLQVRQATAAAMGFTGNVSAIEDLAVSLADGDEQMRHTAERALEQIDPGWMHTDAALRARDRLESSLDGCPDSDKPLIEHVLAKISPSNRDFS